MFLSRQARHLLSLLLVASGVAACEPDEPQDTTDTDDTGEPTAWEEASSDESRDLSPEVPAADLELLVQGNTELALDLYQHFADSEDGSFFYSPFSISIALAMTWAGARNDTEAQMADSLRFLLDQDALHPAFNALDLELDARSDDGVDQERPFQLEVANSIWGQIGYPFLVDFLDVLAVNYGAGLNLLDFSADPEDCRQVINEWVEDNTEGRIEDLIPEGAISELTRLVLTNAIYFNAAWNNPFDEELTEDGDFWLLNGSTVTASFMNQTAEFPYYEDEDLQAVQLPYDGENLSMLVLLPAESAFEIFEASIDSERLEDVLDGMDTQRVELSLPRFGDETSFDLGETLKALGMTDAFDAAQADFTGMESSGELFISRVIHKSFVAVDEAGTEAAAATAVIMDGGTSAPPGPVELRVDRPFVYLVRDIPTGSVLFMGRMLDPGA